MGKKIKDILVEDARNIPHSSPKKYKKGDYVTALHINTKVSYVGKIYGVVNGPREEYFVSFSESHLKNAGSLAAGNMVVADSNKHLSYPFVIISGPIKM